EQRDTWMPASEAEAWVIPRVRISGWLQGNDASLIIAVGDDQAAHERADGIVAARVAIPAGISKVIRSVLELVVAAAGIPIAQAVLVHGFLSYKGRIAQSVQHAGE